MSTAEGFHHLTVMLEDFEESAMLKERFAEQRKPVLVSGRIGETIGSLHVDTPPSWKIILDSGCGPAIGLQPDCGHPLYPLRCVAPAHSDVGCVPVALNSCLPR